MEHMKCMDKRQICGSLSRGESVHSSKHLISAAASKSACKSSLASNVHTVWHATVSHG